MTKIRWTDETWNPTTGCSRVSPGCEHCYAETISLRFGRSKKPWTAQNAKENVVLHPERLKKPLSWKTPKRVFVNSMSDLFHELIPDEFIDRVFEVMEQTPQHIYQILTKRPKRMRDYVLTTFGHDDLQYQCPNVWLGTSVEDQRRADERIPLLLDTPAAIRFLSCEPLLAPVNLEPFLWEEAGPEWAGKNVAEPGIDWVIVGGESGPGYRPMDHQWARDIRDECLEAGVSFFFKQSSGPRTEMGKELDGQIWEQFPNQAVQIRTEKEELPA